MRHAIPHLLKGLIGQTPATKNQRFKSFPSYVYFARKGCLYQAVSSMTIYPSKLLMRHARTPIPFYATTDISLYNNPVVLIIQSLSIRLSFDRSGWTVYFCPFLS